MDLTAMIRRPTEEDEDGDAGKPEKGKEGDRQKCVQRLDSSHHRTSYPLLVRLDSSHHHTLYLSDWIVHIIVPHNPCWSDWIVHIIVPHTPCWSDWIVHIIVPHNPCWSDWGSFTSSYTLLVRLGIVHLIIHPAGQTGDRSPHHTPCWSDWG
ncbi:UNVERIFIED_CONTAM: hypothetical protein FKN15_036219 [Acipenser sinensis]